MRLLLILLVVLLLVLQYKFWFGPGGFTSTLQLKNEIQVQKDENFKLQQRNAVLLADIKALKKSDSAVESRARSELGMVKQGEVFYQVVS